MYPVATCPYLATLLFLATFHYLATCPYLAAVHYWIAERPPVCGLADPTHSMMTDDAVLSKFARPQITCAALNN